jgi:DNA-directed RNA polymerase subunit N (RpoN/RPB10)
MLVPIICFTCGCPIGDKEDLFNKLKEEKAKKLNIRDIDNKELDCSDILNKLDINNDCCRMHLITSMQFTDYY